MLCATVEPHQSSTIQDMPTAIALQTSLHHNFNCCDSLLVTHSSNSCHLQQPSSQQQQQHLTKNPLHYTTIGYARPSQFCQVSSLEQVHHSSSLYHSSAHFRRRFRNPAQVNLVSSTTSSYMQDIQNQPTLSSTDVQSQHSTQELDKKAICQHPLFPLLALLFDKCELATTQPDPPPCDNFEADIQAFVDSQYRVFDGNHELDNVIVKAIQVLRIHLLELQKVNELCRDFCSRYINTLRSRYQNDAVILDGMPDSPSESECLSPPPSVVSLPKNTLNACWTSASTNPHLRTSPNWHHHSLPYSTSASGFHPHDWSSAAASSNGLLSFENDQLHDHSLSFCVNDTVCDITSCNGIQHPNMNEDERHKLKRGVLPKRATHIMKQWLFQHLVHPYPSEDEKRLIASQTSLTLLQVNNWFINARRRILQPMLEASNPEPISKKKKPASNRPSNARFWPPNLVTKSSVNLVETANNSNDVHRHFPHSIVKEHRKAICEDEEEADDEDDEYDDEDSIEEELILQKEFSPSLSQNLHSFAVE